MIATALLIGVIAGLLGIFYRNCLKGKEMIFYPFYQRVLCRWAESPNRFLRFITYPLGYCIYCSTTWIGFLCYGIYLASFYALPDWSSVVLGLFAVMGVSHLIALIACRCIINGHPDFDTTYTAKEQADTAWNMTKYILPDYDTVVLAFDPEFRTSANPDGILLLAMTEGGIWYTPYGTKRRTPIAWRVVRTPNVF